MLIRRLVCAYKEACASPLSLGIHKYYIPSVSFHSSLFSYEVILRIVFHRPTFSDYITVCSWTSTFTFTECHLFMPSGIHIQCFML